MATVPTARTPAVTPNAKISRSITPRKPKNKAAQPIEIKAMPVVIKKRQILVNKTYSLVSECHAEQPTGFYADLIVHEADGVCQIQNARIEHIVPCVC